MTEFLHSCFLQLRNIAINNFFLTQAYLERLCIMSSYLDYYNFPLLVSQPKSIRCLQLVQNSAAKCLTKSERQDHITSILATRYELSLNIHSSGHTHLSDPTGLSSWWDSHLFKHFFPLMKQLLLISHCKRCEREWKMNLWLCVCVFWVWILLSKITCEILLYKVKWYLKALYGNAKSPYCIMSRFLIYFIWLQSEINTGKAQSEIKVTRMQKMWLMVKLKYGLYCRDRYYLCLSPKGWQRGRTSALTIQTLCIALCLTCPKLTKAKKEKKEKKKGRGVYTWIIQILFTTILVQILPIFDRISA